MVRVGAVRVVPPVADEHGLVEDGALGTQEAVLAPVRVAVVIHLREEKRARDLKFSRKEGRAIN